MTTASRLDGFRVPQGASWLDLWCFGSCVRSPTVGATASGLASNRNTHAVASTLQSPLQPIAKRFKPINRTGATPPKWGYSEVRVQYS
ncbi:hypothetical protein J0895_02685 [Phormidium pseudopriestleyi FRX01]|uniref:Uncharacterized protein n=1 Tax=Phormidium pseudopriestleyi FRX01 TaxID=1759528 RepID=A0ABS3FNR1_9CYAN|nr:hypothetical protein [Phormidium pseudopriestleyi]MBO0348027.1 hypothetical protein [Phormidium pseudopriestleyi FRX01]